MSRPWLAFALAVLPACAAKAQQKVPPVVPLATPALAGQVVTVLPLTMAVTDPRLPGGGGGAAGRAATLALFDSLLADLLQERAPEVTWMLPPELRTIAARAPGMLPSPDRMGQSVLRDPKATTVPDPLRGYLRNLLALANGARFAFVPAALTLAPAAGDSVEATVAAVLTDGRIGTVLWRTRAVGRAANATDAIRVAVATILPVEP